jgi:glycosyltransferase involved in cell wall biosynthesis
MDGGSKDETLDVLRSFAAPELKWWSEPDKGVVDAVNKGMAKARGEILTIQSSDDVFLPGAISAAVEALQSPARPGLVYGDVELIDAQSQLVGVDEQGPFDLAEYLGRLHYIPQPGAFFTRAAMQSAGGWRDEVSYAADADYWMRIAIHHPVVKINRRLARYRYHEEQRDKQRARIATDWQQAIRDLLSNGNLNARQRRHARMGMHLARHRYADPRAWMTRTAAAYAALLANPAVLLDRRFPRRDLLPGRDPLWALLSRLKRRLGLRPRGG